MNNETLIAAAEARAALYEDDDRQDIKTDVMNAFFAGAKFGALAERERIAMHFAATPGREVFGQAAADEIRESPLRSNV